MAVGILYGADTFLTNDSGLKKVKDIKVVTLEDFLGGKTLNLKT